MRRFALAITLSLLLSVAIMDGALAQAPYRDAPTGPTTTETLRQPTIDNSLGGILDPSRFQMNHQLGFGYMGAGGNGYSQGYYLNTLSYKFNAPVLLRLRTGVTNNPFAASGSMTQPGESALSSFFNNAEFFGGADLIWKPSDKVRLQLSVDRMPAGMVGYNRYYNPFGYGGMFNRYGHDGLFGADMPWYGPSAN